VPVLDRLVSISTSLAPEPALFPGAGAYLSRLRNRFKIIFLITKNRFKIKRQKNLIFLINLK
jgi:hypothetical protein